MVSFGIFILPGDIFGFVALGFIIFTAIFMLVRKKLLKYTKNLERLRRVHIYAATAGGIFLMLHVAYFITWPLTIGVLLGYVSASIATAVWLTGTAFLERFRDSLFFHGSLSLGAISLMVIHAASAGINFPILIGYGILLITTLVIIYKASQHATKTLKAAGFRIG
jgi:hypothetical protein